MVQSSNLNIPWKGSREFFAKDLDILFQLILQLGNFSSPKDHSPPLGDCNEVWDNYCLAVLYVKYF